PRSFTQTQKRTGWVDHKGPHFFIPSISDHMYRMALLAMCTSDAKLDVSKCVMMCLVHDLAEAQVGDIAPREGITKAEKRKLEADAMHNFVYEMLHGSPAALRIEDLWKEYEEGESDEAKFVKGLAHGAQTLQPFFDSSLPYVRHDEVKSWGNDLVQEREKISLEGR
ncbi:hypothetical protein SERLA73DRAFT_66326, partial [Serpula lacrymans var. lacrymans S7.3]